jgi:hypothetical protein
VSAAVARAPESSLNPTFYSPWPQDEVDLQFGYTVRIVQSAAELNAADGWQQAAFLVGTIID